MHTHVIFGEHHCTRPLPFRSLFQKAPAEQGQILEGDLILANEQKIGADGELGSCSISGNAMEGEPANVVVLVKASENEFH